MEWFKNLFNFTSESTTSICPSINPANGLPMIEESCIDIEGNPYGTSSFFEESISQFDDDNFFTSSFDSFSDDSWNSDNSWDSTSDL